MHKAISRALWGALFVGGLTALGAGAAHAADTSGEDGIASGSQVGILAEIPVTIGGNAVSILGDSVSSGTAAAASGGGDSTAGNATTSGDDAIAGGTQVMPDVMAPVVVSGNAISILGDSTTDAEPTAAPAGSVNDSSAYTSGEDAIASGNQVTPDANLPIVIGGNSISVIGDSTATGSQSSTPNGGATDGAATTTGEDGIASGNQVSPAIAAPVAVGGNDISVIRDRFGVDAGYFDGALDSSMVNLRILDDLLLANPVAESGMPFTPGVAESLISEPVITAPLVRGPLLRAVAVDVPTSAPAAPAAGNNATAAEGSGSGMTPMLATAALSPAVTLAATGVEALPLIGGIAVMLATGLGLLGLKRAAHAMG